MSGEPRDVATAAARSSQRSRAVSLGIFIATAVVLFGVILAGYGLVRFDDPEAFAWAPRLLDRRLGAAGAATLMIACIFAAGAARLALVGRIKFARPLLGVAVVAGVATLVVRGLEYPSIARGAGFVHARDVSAATSASKAASSPATSAVAPADLAHGKAVFLKTCAACHAPDGSGVKAQGANLRESDFVKGKTDDELLAFVKVGRQPFDPETKLHLAMPARGGNPALTDQDLVDAIANVRQLQKQAAAATVPAVDAKAVNRAAAPIAADQPQVIEGELWLPHSILPAANPGPPGASRATVSLQRVGARAQAPANVRRFFLIVLFLGGLQAVYLLFGVGLSAWAISLPSVSWRSSTLALVAIYWVVITGIGLLLLPALYL